MYLVLQRLYLCFEKLDDDDHYLNTLDYRMYRAEEAEKLVYSGLYEHGDFLLVQRLNFSEIAKRYLFSINNKSLLRKLNDRDSYARLFWPCLSNERLESDFQDYRKAALVSFAKERCDANNIKCSVHDTR